MARSAPRNDVEGPPEDSRDSLLPLLQRMARPPATAFAPGAMVGRYRVVSLIGRGGMGEVYRARDDRLGRDVALKVMRADGRADSLLLKRFASEAKAVGSLNHPNVVAVFDTGEEAGCPYLVTELLEGQTLADRLCAGALEPATAVEVAAGIARALAAAHAAGVVHRDLKPANVFLTADGRVKVLDFGLAKWMRPSPLPRDDTAPGVLLGTTDYMSPEQVRAEPVDHRSDVFSFGTVLYEMLAGQPPFRRASTAETAAAILRDAAPALPDGAPRALAGIIGHCLQKNRADRVQSMGEVLAGLEAGDASTATARLPRATRARIRLGGLLGAIGIALAAIPWLVRRARAQPPPTIAVLPFLDLSPAHDQQYFSDGVAEEILDALARVDGLRVIARTSSFAFRGKEQDLREIGDKLGATGVLEGSVRREGTRMRITAQLVDARSGHHRWSRTVERNDGDTFAAQDEIARAVVAELRPGSAKPAPAAPETANVEAHDEFLIGRQLCERYSREDFERALAHFRRAVELDPGYARAWAWKAIAEMQVSDWDEGASDLVRAARESGAKAVELGPSIADAFLARSRIEAFDWQFEAAVRDAQRAKDLDPQSIWVLSQVALVLQVEGRIPESVVVAQTMTERDPLSRRAWLTLGNTLASAERWDDCRKAYGRANELAPKSGALWGMAWCDLLGGRPQQALEVIRARSDEPAATLMGVAIASRMLGREEEAKKALDELARSEARDSCFWQASAFAMFGEADRAISALDLCVQRQKSGPPLFRSWPFLKPLRGMPRFEALARRAGLPAPASLTAPPER